MGLHTINDVKLKFDSYKELVKFVMSEKEETRSNDTLLFLYCCVYLGAKTIKDMKKLNLNIITIHKTRQIIQNKEGLYRPTEAVQWIREERDGAVRDYMSDSE